MLKTLGFFRFFSENTQFFRLDLALSGASWEPLGGLLEPLGGVLGAPWRLMGASWEPLGAKIPR